MKGSSPAKRWPCGGLVDRPHRHRDMRGCLVQPNLIESQHYPRQLVAKILQAAQFELAAIESRPVQAMPPSALNARNHRAGRLGAAAIAAERHHSDPRQPVGLELIANLEIRLLDVARNGGRPAAADPAAENPATNPADDGSATMTSLGHLSHLALDRHAGNQIRR